MNSPPSAPPVAPEDHAGLDSHQRGSIARAFDRASKAAPPADRDPEETRAILMTGIIDAARRGVSDETVLTDAALAALLLYDNDKMDAVMRETPL
jgi:hypothetical protein